MIKYARFILFFALSLSFLGVFSILKPANACSDCPQARKKIKEAHEDNEDDIADRITQSFHEIRDFISDDYFKKYVLPSIQRMTQHLSAAALNQTFIIGTFFDAKQQLEARRNFEALKFEAHKDYQPSQGFCSIGTSARSLVHSDLSARQNAHALNRLSMLRATSNQSLPTYDSAKSDDTEERWDRFVRVHCDVRSNGFGGPNEKAHGLDGVCKSGVRPEDMNKDVDFTAGLDQKRTVNVNFTNAAMEGDEHNIMALGQNLYGSNNLPAKVVGFLKSKEESHRYFPLRSIMAKRNVARGTFDAHVAMKSSGLNSDAQSDPETYRYLAAALSDLGMSETEILELIGENPSYFAQLEVLSKRLYQSPNFIAALYDSPANVKRKAAALTAINLMVDRAIFESEMRQETLLSVLLTTDYRKDYQAAQAAASRRK